MTENQVGREFWYLVVSHTTIMLNQVTGRLGLKINTPFELVNNAKLYYKTWFELFSIGYFNHHIDNTTSRSKLQAHTLDGIAVGRDDKTNPINFY